MNSRFFFDVDGVLIQGSDAGLDQPAPWDQHLARDLGIEPHLFQQAFFRGEGAPMRQCMLGQRDLLEALDEVLSALGSRVTPQQFADYWFAHDAHLDQSLLALVDRMRRGAQVYIATGQEHHRAKYLWETLGLTEHFDGLFHTAAIGSLKTDAGFYAAIDRSFSSDTAISYFFDDRADVVAAANAYGWQATLYRQIDDVADHAAVRQVLEGS